MPSQNRIPQLLVAAAVQYLGSNTRRQYDTLLKITALVVPSVRTELDTRISGKQPNIQLDPVKLAEFLLNPLQVATAIRDFILDLVFALIGAIALFFASIWLIFGFIVELIFGIVAEVIRGENGAGVGAQIKDAFSDLKNLIKQIDRAWKDAQVWDLDAAFSTTEQPCSSTILNRVLATEPNSTTAYSFCTQTSEYKEYGVRLDYRLFNGLIEFRDWTGFDDPNTQTPQWISYANRGGFSYHKNRQGQHYQPDKLPKFDMMVASNDRVFAKVIGKADFWFGTPSEIFAGTESSTGLPVPSLYFKIDPTPTDAPSGRVKSISNQSGKLNNYLRDHPQAARLPLLHALVGGGALPAMVVSVQPRTMYQLDTRPPRLGVYMNHALTRLTTGLKTRNASKHVSPDDPNNEQYGLEFEFDSVQGLGVGNYHFYENWTADHGGEIQFLLTNSTFGLRLNPALYGLFNGPIQDADGACDGTCNFYVLARLKKKDGSHRWGILWCDEQTFFTKRWRLVDPRDNLPTSLNLPNDVNLSVHALVNNDSKKGILNGIIDFDEKRFIDSDPFEQGYIDENTRLAVARQVLVVNGKRPASTFANVIPNQATKLEDCLYSINFSYGSVDRQWRSRQLPSRPTFGQTIPHISPPTFDFDSLHIREDMTISLRGSKQGSLIDGRWVQRYLPCDRRYPESSFNHPWRYIPEAAYQRLLNYPIFGVLEKNIDGRNQYYEVDILKVDDEIVSESTSSNSIDQKLASLDGNTLIDNSDTLYIRARVFKWGEMNDPSSVEKWLAKDLPESINAGSEISETGDHLFFSWNKSPVPNTEYRKSRTSMYNASSHFKIVQRGQLGWLLIWKDKRDDDLISISDLPIEVNLEVRAKKASPQTASSLGGSLTAHSTNIGSNLADLSDSISATANLNLDDSSLKTQCKQVRVRINRHHRIELPPCASRVEFSMSANGSPDIIIIRIHSPLPPVQFLRNIWRLHLAAYPDGAREPAHIKQVPTGSSPDSIYEDFFIQRGNTMTTRAGGSVWSMEVKLKPSNVDLLKKSNSEIKATCVWLEGPTGIMSTPDFVQFIA